MQKVDEYVFGLEKNNVLRDHLIEIGYHPNFWSQNLYLLVEVELKYNTIENHKNALLGCYGEYVDILKSMDILGLTVEDEKDLKVDLLFSSRYNEEALLTLEEIEKRRQIAISKIKSVVEEKKESENQFSLFLDEIERIEVKAKKLCEKYQNQLLRESKKTSSSKEILFFARVNNTFFRTAAVCNTNVIFYYLFFFFVSKFIFLRLLVVTLLKVIIVKSHLRML
jgi:hypothetical protein